MAPSRRALRVGRARAAATCWPAAKLSVSCDVPWKDSNDAELPFPVSPGDLKIGTLSLRHEAVNVTLERELMARGVFDDEYDNNMEIVEDEVIAKL